MKRNNLKAWLYLLPALLFLIVFLVYPLIDVLIYSVEEGYNFASQTYFGVGTYNFSYVLHDPYFLQALKNTFILVVITVPLSTLLALLISAGLSSIKPLRDLLQTSISSGISTSPSHPKHRQIRTAIPSFPAEASAPDAVPPVSRSSIFS